jgi:beta-glucosidase-like glycosyl hydrolase
MCSYNSVNGVPSCANSVSRRRVVEIEFLQVLLQDLLVDQWGFDGYVVGDCGAIDDIQLTHNYTHNVSVRVLSYLLMSKEHMPSCHQGWNFPRLWKLLSQVW